MESKRKRIAGRSVNSAYRTSPPLLWRGGWGVRPLLVLLFSFFTLHSFAQEPAWGTQAKADSLDAREKRAVQKFLTEFDRWLIVDFARQGLIINTLVKTSPFLQYPAMNPELGAYLSTFERETGTTIILRAYIDIDYFNPWVASYRGSQKTRKAFEINKAKPAHAVIDIAYSPAGMKSKYEVAGYNITVRDSLRTPAFREIFGEEDFIRMRDTLQAAMGSGPVQGVDSAGFNAAVIRALEALKGDPKTKPDPGYKVTFRKGEAKGYDAYRYPALSKHYHTDNAGNPVPWLSASIRDALTLQGRYEVKDPEAAKETPLNIEVADLTAGDPQVKDTILTQALRPAGEAREVDIMASYFRTNRFGKGVETVAGQVALAVYKEKEMNLVVVLPADSRNNIPQVDAKKLESYLDEVYRPALVSWKVRTETLDYDYPATLEVDSERAKYSAGMNAMIKAFKKQKDVESKTCYVLLIPGLSGGATGFMPFKGQFAFVTSSGDIFHTIAHELGHGPFRLRHTFSQEGYVAGQGTTDNLMDYTTGNKTILYKHQWDLVHDPETMLFAGREDADEVLEIGKTLPAINLSQYQGYAFLTPSGDAITINGIKEGTFNYDGGLLNFTLNNNTKIYGIFVKDPDEKFIGYYTSEVLSTFRDNNTFSKKLVLGDKATLDKLNEYLFTNYSFAKINSLVFATAKIITNGKYSDCYCYYQWANIKQSNSLTTVVPLSIIPSGAQKIGFATDCNAEMHVSLYEIQQGIGSDVFISLFDITPNDKIDHLADLCIWLTKLCGDKRYGFYVEKYKNSADFKDFIKYLQENTIYTRQHFEQTFTQLSCSGYDIVFSETDLWKDIDRKTYNSASVDWTSYSLPEISNEDELYEALDRLEFIISEIKNDAPTAIAEKSYNNLIDYISECADDPEKALSNIPHLNQTFKTIHAYLGMYLNYEYSLSDLVVRHSLKQQGDFWGVIKDSELRGEAAPVSSINGYSQYLAYYDTESAYFIGEKFQGMMGTIYALYGLSQGMNAMGGAARSISQHRATLKIAINRNNLLNTKIQYSKILRNAENYIKRGRFVNEVEKIDLMGGQSSQLEDFINIDIKATKGIKGDVRYLSQFIKPNSISEIVCTNPQAEFITECSKVMRPGAKIYINGTARNGYFSSITKSNVEKLGFEMLSEKQALNSRFSNLKFYFTDGISEIPQSSMYTTILIKK
jgi:hypothetical protein